MQNGSTIILMLVPTVHRRGSTLQVVRELLIGADPVKPVHMQIDSGYCCPTAIRGSAGVSARAQAYLYALDGRCLER